MSPGGTPVFKWRQLPDSNPRPYRNASASGSSGLEMLIKEFKYIRLPCRDIFVQVVMPVVCREANRWIDFKNVRFVQTLKFRRQSTPSARIKVVFGMREHDGCGRLLDGAHQSLAQLWGAFP